MIKITLTMHPKRCLDSKITLNKDVLGIIGGYVKPKLWLYWVYNECIYKDEIKFSKVVEADTYQEACVKIFDDNAEFLFKNKFLKHNNRGNETHDFKKYTDSAKYEVIKMLDYSYKIYLGNSVIYALRIKELEW